jgi:hypothetical protein
MYPEQPSVAWGNCSRYHAGINTPAPCKGDVTHKSLGNVDTRKAAENGLDAHPHRFMSDGAGAMGAAHQVRATPRMLSRPREVHRVTAAKAQTLPGYDGDDALCSAGVLESSPAERGLEQRSLLLFDDFDLLLEQDVGFLTSVVSLLYKSKVRLARV